jgi:alcohol dehydrogenase
VVNTARVQAGASTAVIGLGGVGLCSLLGAIAAGAREIIAIDLADDKLAFARQLGATATFNARDPDCAEQVRSATGGGVEFAFELAGSVRALELAYKITRRGGTTVTAGLPPPTATMALPAVNLVAEERDARRAAYRHRRTLARHSRFIQLYQRGRLPVDRLMSGTDPDQTIWLRPPHDGSAIRQVVTL